MGALVDVTEVVLAEPDGRLLGSSIDAPAAVGGGAREAPAPGGAPSSTYGLRVEGWALGRKRSVSAIELTQDDAPVAAARPERPRSDVRAQFPESPDAAASGFATTVNTLSLPPEFELRVHATLEAPRGRPRLVIGAIKGRRRPIVTGHQSRIRPLMVTTPGRTGSNMLLSLLGGHPEIATYRPFGLETKVGMYWIDVLRELTEPASYERQVTHDGAHRRGWWRADETPRPRPVPDERLETWLGADAVSEIAAVCQGRIDAGYGRIAAEAGCPQAAYYAEKFVPGPVPSLMWELYPAAKELILVRDFRDMVTSMMAFNEKWNVKGFGAGLYEKQADQVRGLGGLVPRLLGARSRRGNCAHVVRYEDLVLHPDETLAAILEYLELDTGDTAVSAMRQTLASAAGSSDHGTSSAPGESIGRWRTELSDDLKTVCEEVFGAALAAFGYSGDENGRPAAPVQAEPGA